MSKTSGLSEMQHGYTKNMKIDVGKGTNTGTDADTDVDTPAAIDIDTEKDPAIVIAMGPGNLLF
jgi:hypothetical protein